MSSIDDTHEWLARALSKATGKAVSPLDPVVLDALMAAGPHPSERYYRGLQRLVGNARCSECGLQKRENTCFNNHPDGSSCGWMVCDDCLRAVLPQASIRDAVIAECAAVCDRYWNSRNVVANPETSDDEHMKSIGADDCSILIRALAAQPAPVRERLIQREIEHATLALRATAPYPVEEREIVVRDALRALLAAVAPDHHVPDTHDDDGHALVAVSDVKDAR